MIPCHIILPKICLLWYFDSKEVLTKFVPTIIFKMGAIFPVQIYHFYWIDTTSTFH